MIWLSSTVGLGHSHWQMAAQLSKMSCLLVHRIHSSHHSHHNHHYIHGRQQPNVDAGRQHRMKQKGFVFNDGVLVGSERFEVFGEEMLEEFFGVPVSHMVHKRLCVANIVRKVLFNVLNVWFQFGGLVGR